LDFGQNEWDIELKARKRENGDMVSPFSNASQTGNPAWVTFDTQKAPAMLLFP